MSDRLRVALFPADETGCGRYRIRYPAAAIGEDIDAIWPSPGSRNLFRIAVGQLDVDVVVLQRPAHKVVVDLIPVLQGLGVAVVVELDDDLATAHPQSPIFQALHPSDRLHNWQHIKRACKMADLVTASTPVLAERYGGPGKAVVLRNRVPQSLLEVTADRDGRTIGWGGTTETHIDDLKVTRGGVAQAVEETSTRFLQVGPTDGVKQDLGLDADPDTTGGLPFGEYHQALAQLDVGIAPLADSVFNRAKSALKVLEYAALGVPCVGSPRPEYALLAEEGLCAIAQDRARDWRRECKRLLADPELRADRAAHARQVIAERHLYEGSGHLWAEAWQEAVSRRVAARMRSGILDRASKLKPGEAILASSLRCHVQ